MSLLVDIVYHLGKFHDGSEIRLSIIAVTSLRILERSGRPQDNATQDTEIQIPETRMLSAAAGLNEHVYRPVNAKLKFN